MSDYEPLVVAWTEGKGDDSISGKCPECGEQVFPTLDGSWGGSEVSSFSCNYCDEELTVGIVSTDKY